jgi:hypothetical protein
MFQAGPTPTPGTGPGLGHMMVSFGGKYCLVPYCYFFINNNHYDKLRRIY